ncbi:MAG: hypothetical protein ACOYUK_03885 [Patescibacteria group bacterium]
MLRNIVFISSAILLVLLISGCTNTDTSTNQTSNLNTASTNSGVADTNAASADNSDVPEGGVYVEAETGTLEKSSEYSYSYIGESARGGEAYLADGGDSARYVVSVPQSGQYILYARLSDDAMHDNGSRSATVTINSGAMLRYTHTSEDTKGWKWYMIGNAGLSEGENTLVFTKDELTTAAYTMDAFKLIPSFVNE